MAEGRFDARKSERPIDIDGCSREPVWAAQDWYGLNYVWMGAVPSPTDYQGRFKVAWTRDSVALLVEVIDDVLHPTLADGLDDYWKGDYVEVFLDEDRSGGDHQYGHQAFAYHVSTEGHAIDKSTAQETMFFDDHVEVARTKEGKRHLWEMKIRVFGADFREGEDNSPVLLAPGKVLGFSLAYGDNDGKQSRENFMGSRKTHGKNNDEGYVDADVFGSLRLLE
ncbi:MAG: sugar-binding protein [Myxococcota bacterium]